MSYRAPRLFCGIDLNTGRLVTPYKRVALEDRELLLLPVYDDDGEMIDEWLQARPDVAALIQYPRPWDGKGVFFSNLWKYGAGCAWIVHTEERADIGLVWAHPHPGLDPEQILPRPMWNIAGCADPDYERPPGQAARALQLVAAHVRSLGEIPVVFIPCGNTEYLEWAKESGLPWRSHDAHSFQEQATEPSQ